MPLSMVIRAPPPAEPPELHYCALAVADEEIAASVQCQGFGSFECDGGRGIKWQPMSLPRPSMGICAA